DLLQVVDELGEVLDGIDVVVGRRRDEAHPGLGVTQARDLRRDLVTRELPSFTGLRALRHLDVQLVRVHAVLGRDTETARRNLLDARVAIALGAPGPEPVGRLTALPAVAAAADHVHRNGEG